MKKFIWALIVVLASQLMACANEESNVEVSLSQSPLPLIPAPAISCLSHKNAGTEPPSFDISQSYFKVPTFTFTRKDKSKTLVIAFMRISIQIPGSSTPVSCEVGGDGLASLSGIWWANSTKEAVIAAGLPTFSTDCPLYCGGIETKKAYTATGIVEVFGLERDAAQEETPVKIQAPITIQSF